MKQRVIVGFTGKAYSGKTTAASYLEGKGFRRLAIADPLKELAIEYFGLTYEDVYIEKPAHVRTLLQGLGSLIREMFNENFFIEELINRIKYSDSVLFVIDDIRLPEEADIIRQMGGIVIRMECPDSPYELTNEQQAHKTEQGVSIVDHVISAPYGDLVYIAQQVEVILSERTADCA